MGQDKSDSGPLIEIDFEVSFTHGGRLAGQRFRLEGAGGVLAEAELAERLVKALQLQAVREVRVFGAESIPLEAGEQAATSRETLAVSDHLVDLSHTIVPGMETYPGFPAPQVSDYISHEGSKGRYAPGVTFHIGRIDMVANSGTSIDSPAHRYAGAADVAKLPIAVTADLDGIVIRLP
jgi:arylformamidase